MQEFHSWISLLSWWKWKVWGWRALGCYCLTNDLNVNNCVKWEETMGFIWQCTKPTVLAAKAGGSMETSGLKKLWGYHQGNSENLQHSEQANSVLRCATNTKATRWRAHGGRKTFPSKLCDRMRQRCYNKPISSTCALLGCSWDSEVLCSQLVSVSPQLCPVPSSHLLHDVSTLETQTSRLRLHGSFQHHSKPRKGTDKRVKITAINMSG